jgi:hypothetical protein
MSETKLPQPARRDPPVGADERGMLESWLEFHRATLLTKLDGLGEKELRTRSVPSSSLSLLGSQEEVDHSHRVAGLGV